MAQTDFNGICLINRHLFCSDKPGRRQPLKAAAGYLVLAGAQAGSEATSYFQEFGYEKHYA
jgi:hypothetical protein